MNIFLTILIAMVPVIELRGAIPIGVANGLEPWFATILAVIGNIIPIPFALLLTSKIFVWLRDKKHTKKMIAWLEKKAEKNRKKVDKFGWLGLLILVAIPLPGTGAWTAALVASVFKMKFKPSLFSIIAGVVIAAVIVFAITYGFTQIV
jgi:uncharacterized membrane protein